MNIQQRILYRNKPYYLHKIQNTLQGLQKLRKKGIRYYYMKIYNTRSNQTAYAIYTDKKVIR